MKNFIYILTAFIASILFVSSCGNYPYREKDVEHQIKESVTNSISFDLLVPSSLKVTEIAYTPMDTVYVADEDYNEYRTSLKVNQKLLSEAKTASDKRIYKMFVERDAEQMKEVIKNYYSPQQLSPTVYTEPLRAYFVSVDYKCKNGFFNGH